jgi:hypothetical protein
MGIRDTLHEHIRNEINNLSLIFDSPQTGGNLQVGKGACPRLSANGATCWYYLNGIAEKKPLFSARSGSGLV